MSDNAEGIPWESDPYKNKYPCAECMLKNVYTRIYVNREKNHSMFLCYCCASDYVEKRGYKELILPFLKSSDVGVKNICEE